MRVLSEMQIVHLASYVCGSERVCFAGIPIHPFDSFRFGLTRAVAAVWDLFPSLLFLLCDVI